MPSIKSVCKKYLAVYETTFWESDILCISSQIRYSKKYTVVDNEHFASKHMILGFSNNQCVRDYKKGFFTLEFADCVDGMKIDPFMGNTIITKYFAVFKTPRENITKDRKQNKTGHTGVYKNTKGFSAMIQIKGEKIRLGTFGTIEQASAAYQCELLKISIK